MAYSIELLARDPIVFNEAHLLAAMRARLGDVEHAPTHEGGTMMFFLKDHVAEFKDASLPAQLVLLPVGSAPDVDKYGSAVQQSWGFPDAGAALATCQHSVLFADMLSGALPQLTRRQLLSAGLAAILETTRIDAVHFVEAHQFLEPTTLLKQLSDPQQMQNPIAGFLNVRFFNVANAPGDMIMDTAGLNAFGLTDLQIHYRGMEPNEIARIVHNTAAYIFERGAVIESGHTIQGRNVEERWRCRQEDSLIEPKRAVLDINPGDPYAAGRRAA